MHIHVRVRVPSVLYRDGNVAVHSKRVGRLVPLFGHTGLHCVATCRTNKEECLPLRWTLPGNSVHTPVHLEGNRVTKFVGFGTNKENKVRGLSIYTCVHR